METARKTMRKKELQKKEKFVTFHLSHAVQIRNGVTMLIVSIPGLHVIHQARIFAIVRSHVSSYGERVNRLVRGVNLKSGI